MGKGWGIYHREGVDSLGNFECRTLNFELVHRKEGAY